MSLRILSPSQVGTLNDCQRIWAFKYLLGQKEPDNEYTASGKAAHKRLEDYYRSGILPASDTPGRVALAALAHMPKFHRDLKPEEPVYEVPFAGGVFGRTDDPERACRMDLYDPRDVKAPALYDLKTVGKLEKTKAPEDLKKDVQVLVYCKEIMRRTGAERVLCHWVYATREDKPKAKKVSFEVTGSDVAEAEVLWQNVVSRIHLLAETNPPIEAVEPNLSRCGKFRSGCFYGPRQKDVCPLTPTERMKAAMMNGTPDNDTRSEITSFLNQSGFGAPPAVAQNLAPPTNAAPPAQLALTFSLPTQVPARPAIDPTNFELPMQPNGAPVPETFRKDFIRFCLDGNQNPLAHLNIEASPAFIEACKVLCGLVPPPAAAPAFTPTVAQVAAVVAPAVQPASPAAVAALGPPPPAEPPVEAPKRSGRPPGSKNKSSTDPDGAPAVSGATLQIVVTREAVDRIAELLGIGR